MSNNEATERRFDAIAFDFDGTITFGEDYLRSVIADTTRYFCDEAGVDFDARLFRSVWDKYLGQGIPNYFAKYLHELTEAGRKSEADRIDEICCAGGLTRVESFSRKYIENNTDITDRILSGNLDPEDKNFKLRFGVRETMLQAQADGLKVIVVSNSITQTLLNNLAVCGIYLKGAVPRENVLDNREPVFIDLVIGSKEVYDAGYSKKPSPDPYFLGADGVDVSMHRMIIVEDSPAGFKSAARAGAGAIIACNHRSLAHPIPTHISMEVADDTVQVPFKPAYILEPGHSMLDAYIAVRDGIKFEPPNILDLTNAPFRRQDDLQPPHQG